MEMRRLSFFTTYLIDFLHLFYPRYCLGCSDSLVKGEEIICTRCMLQMPQTDYHLEKENPLRIRLEGRIKIGYGMALFKFSKDGSVQHLMHQFKYNHHPEIGIMLGKLYGCKMKEIDLSDPFDLIIPVPLHPSRKRKRGYNQSEKFGEGLSVILEIPCTEALVRNAKTLTQTRKTKLNRWQNVSNVFSLRQGIDVSNKHVLLVDDVITTGATLEACAVVLEKCGCRLVSIACLAEA